MEVTDIVMEMTEYNEIKETAFTIEKETTFISEDLSKCKTFYEISDKFENYRFDEFMDLLMNEYGCQSYSTILFSINFMSRTIVLDYVFLKTILEIIDRAEVEYTECSIGETFRDTKSTVDMLLRCNYDKVIVKAKMKIKFYKNRSLDVLDQYEDAEYEEQPAITESAFISDNCSACLSMKPNILNIPCLHLAICCSCEETGKLLKCVVCRKKIKRKIKIINNHT